MTESMGLSGGRPVQTIARTCCMYAESIAILNETAYDQRGRLGRKGLMFVNSFFRVSCHFRDTLRLRGHQPFANPLK